MNRIIEVLIKKAAVDPDFKTLLLENKTEAARSIGLELGDAEIFMLNSISDDQFAAIIAKTAVPQEHHPVFLGKTAALMLAALGATTLIGCGEEPASTTSLGIRPNSFAIPKNVVPPDSIPETPESTEEEKKIPEEVINSDIQAPPANTKPEPAVSLGIRPERPKKATEGIKDEQ